MKAVYLDKSHVVYHIRFVFGIMLALCLYLSTHALADTTVKQTIMVGSSKVQLVKDEMDIEHAIHFRGRIIWKSQSDLAEISGPYKVGGEDVLLIGTMCGGSGCPEAWNVELLIVDAKGTVRFAQILAPGGKKADTSFACDIDFGRPQVIGDVLTFSCRDPNRHSNKTIHWTYSKGEFCDKHRFNCDLRSQLYAGKDRIR